MRFVQQAEQSVQQNCFTQREDCSTNRVLVKQTTGIVQQYCFTTLPPRSTNPGETLSLPPRIHHQQIPSLKTSTKFDGFKEYPLDINSMLNIV